MLEQSFKSYHSIKIWCAVTSMSHKMSSPIFREKLEKTSSICFLLQINKEKQVLFFSKS